MTTETKHLRIEEGPAKPKTRTWHVFSRHTSDLLGEILWFGRWGKYCFFPCSNTLYEQDCLRDLAAFVEARTREHKT